MPTRVLRGRKSKAAETQEEEYDFDDEEEEEESPKRGRDEDDDEEFDDSEQDQSRKTKKQRRQGGDPSKKKQRFKIYVDALTGEQSGDPVEAAVDLYETKVGDGDVKRANAVEEDELKALITKMTRYLLLKGSQKKPIFKKNFTKEVMPQYRANRITTFVLAEAQKILRQVWGYDVVEAPRKSPKEDFKGQIQDAFFVVARKKLNLATKGLLAAEEAKDRGLLMVIFACVASAHRWSLKESELYRYLHMLDSNVPLEPTVPINSAKNFVQGLGNVAEKIEIFVKQGYLLKERNAQDDNEITLGPRAYVDVGRNQILQFQCDALGFDAIDTSILSEMQDNARHDDDDDGDDDQEDDDDNNAKKAKKKNHTTTKEKPEEDDDTKKKGTTKKNKKKKKSHDQDDDDEDEPEEDEGSKKKKKKKKK